MGALQVSILERQLSSDPRSRKKEETVFREAGYENIHSGFRLVIRKK